MDDSTPNHPETPSSQNEEHRVAFLASKPEPLKEAGVPYAIPISPAAEPSGPNQSMTAASPIRSFPDFVNGGFYSLDHRNITVDVTVQMISSTVLSIGGVIGLLFVWLSLGFSWLFWAIAVASLLIMIGMFLVACFWPRIDYRHTSFQIDPLGIEIRQGVWWRHQICVPIGRVQHADVSQGPIQRINGVASLTLHTAGTSNASVSVDGLAHQLAMDIRDWIVHQRNNSDAV